MTSKCRLVAAIIALSGFAATALGNELVPVNEFATESDFTNNFTLTTGFPGLSVVHTDEDDGGIGRGGFVEIPPEIGETTNFVYDTDGSAGTQTFGDVTIAVDHQATHSVGFIVRGHTNRNDSIRTLLTNRNRFRVWHGAQVAEHDSGELVYDETDTALRNDWSHLRLSVRNVGDQVEIVFRGYDSQTRFDESTLVAEHTYTFSEEDSSPYLDDGEIGFRMIGVGTRIDNFAVYEYGTAPESLPYPELTNLLPQPNAQFHRADDGFNFDAVSTDAIDEADVSVVLNGTDISGDLEISGDPEHRRVHYSGLEPDTDYTAEIEVTAAGATTTRTVEFRSETPPDPQPLIDVVEFEDESDLMDNFAVADGTMSFNEEWDRGIGRGGFAQNSGNTNFIYDTDGEAGTQTFQDFSITFDHRGSRSLGFIVRANRETDESIRVMLTDRSRMRVWTASGIEAGGDSGDLQFDESAPSGIAFDEWCHMRLDVRNVGNEIEVTLSAFASQNYLAAPNFQMSYTISSGASSGFLEAGEVGARLIHGTNDVDNFGIYEYGTAPVWRAYPAIAITSPDIDEPVSEGATLEFEVTGPVGTPESGIQLLRDGQDVSAGMTIEGDENHWFVSYQGIDPGNNIVIEAANEEATTTGFFTVQGTPVLRGPFTIYDSRGFDSDTYYPLGDLQEFEDRIAGWQPHSSDPSEIVEVEAPYNKVLRRHQMGGTQRDWLYFPGRSTGIIVVEMDVRVSTTAERTVDLTLAPDVGSGTQYSFVGWGTVADHFTYYDGDNWIGLFEPGEEWHHYRMVNYLSGHYSNTFDLFVDGELLAEKLPFRRTFDPDTGSISALRVNAASGPDGEYVDIDNVRLLGQRFYGPDNLPLTVIRELTSSADGFSVAFDTHLGYDYQVEYTDTLEAADWQILTTVSGDGSVMEVDDSDADSDRRFYRVRTIGATD